MKNLNTSREPLQEAADIISSFGERSVCTNGVTSAQSSHLLQSCRPRPGGTPRLRYNCSLQQLRMHFALSYLRFVPCLDPLRRLELSSDYVAVDEACQRRYHEQQ